MLGLSTPGEDVVCEKDRCKLFPDDISAFSNGVDFTDCMKKEKGNGVLSLLTEVNKDCVVTCQSGYTQKNTLIPSYRCSFSPG